MNATHLPSGEIAASDSPHAARSSGFGGAFETGFTTSAVPWLRRSSIVVAAVLCENTSEVSSGHALACWSFGMRATENRMSRRVISRTLRRLRGFASGMVGFQKSGLRLALAGLRER